MKHVGDDLRGFNKIVNIIETLLCCSADSANIRLNDSCKKIIKSRYLCKQNNKGYEKNASAHVCIIHTRKECISVGINHSPIGGSTFSKHAEVDAICRLLQRPNRIPQNLRLLVLRFTKTGGINCSTPCHRCSRFIEKRLSMFHTVAFTSIDGSVVVILADSFDSNMFNHVSRRFRLKEETLLKKT